MDWPWAKNRSEKVFAVIEIGSGTVSGTLVAAYSEASHKKYRLLGSAHALISIRDSEIDSFLAGIEKALQQLLGELSKQSTLRPEMYFCVLSSPLYVAHTEQIVDERPELFTITEELVARLAQARADERAKNEPLLYASYPDDRNVVIESRVMQVKLNDYDIINPYGQQTRKVALELYFALGSERVISLLSQIFSRETGQIPEWHSFTYCEYGVLRDLYRLNDNFLTVDVGGEITDLSMVAGGRIVDSVSFPLGQGFLIKWLAEAWPTSVTEAASLLRLYETGKLAPDQKQKFDRLLTTIKKEWIDQFRAALGRAAERHIVPAKIFVIGNGLEAKIFLNWIEAEDLSAYTLVPKTVDVDFMDNRVFSVFYDGDTSQLQDTFLLVDSLFCGKIFKAKHFNK